MRSHHFAIQHGVLIPHRICHSGGSELRPSITPSLGHLITSLNTFTTITTKASSSSSGTTRENRITDSDSWLDGPGLLYWILVDRSQMWRKVGANLPTKTGKFRNRARFAFLPKITWKSSSRVHIMSSYIYSCYPGIHIGSEQKCNSWMQRAWLSYSWVIFRLGKPMGFSFCRSSTLLTSLVWLLDIWRRCV